MSDISLAELLDILGQARERTDALWNFFITIHFALFGALVLVRRPLRLVERAVVYVAYLGFAYMNYAAHSTTYEERRVLLEEIAAFPIDMQAPGGLLIELVQRADPSQWIVNLNYIHGAAAVIVLLSLIFQRSLTARDG